MSKKWTIMTKKGKRSLLLLVMTWMMLALACGFGSSSGPPRNAATVTVKANSSLTPWLAEAAAAFNRSAQRTSNRQTAYVVLESVEAGRAVNQMVDSGDLPTLWIPDHEVWAALLAAEGQPAFQADCRSIAQSPLVIGMWRPVAESLGWPGLPLGWLDIGSLAADPDSWAYYSGGEYGDSLRLGHAHPGLSGSGASALLALVQAAQAKSDAVTVADIEQPIVQASVGAFQAAVSWFSPNVDSLGQTMQERGTSYLGAAVMYENVVLTYGDTDPEIIPIYPLEGTFMATHPACLNTNAGGGIREAANLFRDYLLSEEGQQLAVAHGLRPVSSAVPIGAPLVPERGVDLNQPAILFAAPTVETLYAVQELWQSARKKVNLVMLLDTSGSMRGEAMESMRRSAVQFINQMSADDYITIITFDTNPALVVEHAQVGANRGDIVRLIEGLRANGYTALYDAIGDGAEMIARTTSPETTNVLVVLTDGMDTSSSRYRFDQQLFELAAANDTTVFTIAYGRDADEQLMADLAFRTNGNYYKGDETSIAAIYEEMSAAFGGAMGVGR
jgi:Ca-activated chloride channel homolog